MVRKETCPQCKGNKFIAVKSPTAKESWIRCPCCGGQGYKVRLTR